MARTKWVKNPPPVAPGRGKYERHARPEFTRMATALRNSPGRWACIDDRASIAAARAFAQSIKKGTNLAFQPPGHFETTTRGSEVYSRYVGDDGG